MKGKALIRPVLNPRAVDLCIVMDGARISSVTAWEIMKREARCPRPDSAGERSWRHTWVASRCPEQLPRAMFQSRTFCCFTASLWALISLHTAGVLTNQAFHVSLSFTLFCSTIRTRTPKRMDKILSFSEAINNQPPTWLKRVSGLASCMDTDCREEAGGGDALFMQLFSCLPHCLWFY